MKTLTIIEIATLYKIHRQTVYRLISNGTLSKNSDGRIDLSEAIRALGEPSQYVAKKKHIHVTDKKKVTVDDSVTLRADMLQKQLDLANERERFYKDQLQAKDAQITVLQLLLSAPQPKPTESKPIEKEEPLPQPIVEQLEVSRLKPKKGLFSSILKSVLKTH